METEETDEPILGNPIAPPNETTTTTTTKEYVVPVIADQELYAAEAEHFTEVGVLNRYVHIVLERCGTNPQLVV